MQFSHLIDTQFLSTIAKYGIIGVLICLFMEHSTLQYLPSSNFYDIYG